MFLIKLWELARKINLEDIEMRDNYADMDNDIGKTSRLASKDTRLNAPLSFHLLYSQVLSTNSDLDRQHFPSFRTAHIFYGPSASKNMHRRHPCPTIVYRHVTAVYKCHM